MRYQVPQFIEVEDKIFGPLTFRQFVYLAGGIGFLVILYSFLPSFLAILIGGPIAILGVAVAFIKINNRPFINTVESFLRFRLNKKLYLWRKEQKKIPKKKAPDKAAPILHVPKLSESKLKDLAWSLDNKESIYAGTKNQQK